MTHEQLVALATQKLFSTFIPQGPGEEYQIKNLARATWHFANVYQAEQERIYNKEREAHD